MHTPSAIAAALVFSTVLGSGVRASGAEPSSADEYSSGDTDTKASPFGPKLAEPPGPAGALEAYAGLSLLVGSGPTRSRGLVGGLLRARFGYVQAGGAVEISDSGQADALGESLEESWRTYQGFVGAWLPFERWIDLDAAVGYAVRRYSNPDPIYGPNGFDEGGSAVTFRFGISDRLRERTFGARLGAALMGTVDLASISVPYERRYLTGGGIGVTRGTTDVGGVSVALVVTGGFELGGGATSRLSRQ